MEKIVTGCVDCPFKYEYDMAVGYGCKIDTSDRTIKQSKKYQPIDPEWCPLKSGGILVKLNKANVISKR
ncbi:MAG: hypothetical protein UR61_C0047G0011 [candidate division WS6 bacterium GW2011_GWE1_34_7]|uniref:Uncharacterized protein n=1 Tax=candidate division WS6 bacterium GW2011_GWE1_34_7 TaxID=1619093 RepID=A0A0G0B4Y1_9BACT|nr:MAG: hypothetical protein UR61_C0047G0011 [candidate division WS6 bacterium GW2011_GWE1_34_7]